MCGIATRRRDDAAGSREGSSRHPNGAAKRVAFYTRIVARKGEVRTRSGDAYKASAIRGYEQAMRLRVYRDLGDEKFGSIRRVDLQDLADRLVASGLSPSTVEMALVPLKAIYRRAANRGEVAVNPTIGLDLPVIRSGRRRSTHRRGDARSSCRAGSSGHPLTAGSTASTYGAAVRPSPRRGCRR